MSKSKEKKTPTPNLNAPIASEAPNNIGHLPLGAGLTPVHVECFMQMMGKYQIDEMQFGSIKLVKSQHVFPDLTSESTKTRVSDEDVLYASSST